MLSAPRQPADTAARNCTERRDQMQKNVKVRWSFRAFGAGTSSKALTGAHSHASSYRHIVPKLKELRGVPWCRSESFRVRCTTFNPWSAGSNCCGCREAQLLRRVRVMRPEVSLLVEVLARSVYNQVEGRSTCFDHRWPTRRRVHLTLQSGAWRCKPLQMVAGARYVNCLNVDLV
jgi:hypothetical protein